MIICLLLPIDQQTVNTSRLTMIDSPPFPHTLSPTHFSKHRLSLSPLQLTHYQFNRLIIYYPPTALPIVASYIYFLFFSRLKVVLNKHLPLSTIVSSTFLLIPLVNRFPPLITVLHDLPIITSDSQRRPLSVQLCFCFHIY